MTGKLKKQIWNVLRLSIPAILTQIATIVMQYIDSAMVGRLGENAIAAIGLVSTSTWLFGGIVSSIAIGFSVQIAHACGAKNYTDARIVLRHGLIFSSILAFILLIIGVSLSFPLPVILKADESIRTDASLYFLIFSISLPFMQLNILSSSSLQCSGNMVIPSILNAVMCLLDVVFNLIFIPKFGVLGASIGTGLSVVVISIVMFYFCAIKNKTLNIRIKDKTKYNKLIIKKAIKISSPVAVEQATRSLAMIVSTGIVAPLGNTAIAANSIAVTAESLCYMPGFGIAEAATTLVGQEVGKKDYKNAFRYGNLSTMLGCVVMTLMAVIMFFAAPYIFNLLTNAETVSSLATTVLRVGLFAEPLYGVSIVASGALRGVEDTFVPSILNLLSIWVVRITLSFILVIPFGLLGVWMANTIELCVRGIVLLIRQLTSKYYKPKELILTDL